MTKKQKASLAKVWWSLGPKTAKVTASLKLDKATGEVFYQLKLPSKMAWGPGVSTELCVNLPGGRGRARSLPMAHACMRLHACQCFKFGLHACMPDYNICMLRTS